MHCLSRVRSLQRHIGGQKNGDFDQNRNSTGSLGGRVSCLDLLFF
jgi:hypothetical protein